MRHFLLIISVLCVLISCSSTPDRDQSTYGTESGNIHVVQKGDTLTSIAWRYGTTTRKLIALNKLSNANKIFVGQRLRTHSPASVTQKPSTTSKNQTYVKKADWVWPVRGTIIRKFNPKRIGGNGIRIRGKKGQTVNAAEGGKVEYQGGGLNGYGQVVIIRHDNGYLSAYGFLGKTFVRKGQYIKKRQRIGTVGITSDKKYALLFEVRRNGKPVNPLHYIGYKYHF